VLFVTGVGGISFGQQTSSSAQTPPNPAISGLVRTSRARARSAANPPKTACLCGILE
jgi:hypothetical protein